MSWKITLIGTGNVAAFWVKTLLGKSFCELNVIGSNVEKTNVFKAEHRMPTNAEFPLLDSDFILVCVQDRFIDAVLQTVPDHTPVFISAGFFSIQPYPHKNMGVMYPLQSIDKFALPNLSEVPFLLELSPAHSAFVLDFAKEIGMKYVETDEKSRFQAHISAVFINNFGYFIMKQGLSLGNEEKLPLSIFQPLIEKTFANLLNEKDLQTGPARRGDQITMDKHMAMLSDEMKTIYSFLSDVITKKYPDEL